MEHPLRVLANIADAFDANELDDEARKFWGRDQLFENDRDPDNISLYEGRGGKTLLTLGDCLRARKIIKANEDQLRRIMRGPDREHS